jgi:hypothetical protein
MKVRNGFVSNSSTSSFCIFGISFKSTEELARLLNVPVPAPTVRKQAGCYCSIDRDASKFCPRCGKQAWVEVQDRTNYALRESVEEKCKSSGLSFEQYDDSIYVGGWCRNNGQAGIDELTEINKKLVDAFGKEGSFHKTKSRRRK